MKMLGNIKCIKCDKEIEPGIKTHQTDDGCICDKCMQEELKNERTRKSNKKDK